MTFPFPSDMFIRHEHTNQVWKLPVILNLVGVVFDLVGHMHLLMRQPLMF
jgi:hypothetical protein